MERRAPEGATLRDHGLARRLRSDGFTTFPLLGPADVDRLRALFGELRGWEGEGFQTDLQHPDPDYRRAVNAELGAAVADQVIGHFDGYEPFLYNFLCKFPGEDSALYLHRDWMYVDERTGARTFVVWIPLQDVRGANGRLRVLRGSHAIESAPRGTDLVAPWLDHVDVIDRRLRSVRVEAGTAVVMDNRLTHCSYPNLTDEPRLVVAVGMRPTSAPLVHFRRRDDRTAVRYDVDEDFFCRYTPLDLLEEAPPLPEAEVLADSQDHWTRDELAERLDVGWRPAADRAVRRAAGLPMAARRLRRDPSAAPARAMAAAIRSTARDVVDHGVPLSRHGRSGPGRGPVRRVLVVTTSPDARASTTSLREIVAELRRRDLASVDVWFLTDPEGAAWERSVVLDAPLRTPGLAALSTVHLFGVDRRLRGVRRHVWLARSTPDLIIFDDGLGGPLVTRLRRPHVRALRGNHVPPTRVPADLHAILDDPDLAIVGAGASAPPDVPQLAARSLFTPQQAASDPTVQRERARASLGIPVDAPVVVGSGAHGWVDGSELFLRALWTLEHRRGVAAHGVWILHHVAEGELGPLLAEVERCGLTGRVQLVREDPAIELRAAGDVALLPYRAGTDPSDLLPYFDRSIPVVSFPVWSIDHPLLELVDHLDVEGAANAVARHLGELDSERGDPDDPRPPVARWVDDLLEAASECRR